MFIIGLLCFLLKIVISVYTWMIVVAVLLTYFQPNPHNPAVRFIQSVTEPLFYYSRKYLNFLIISGIDFSPVAIILLLQFIPQLFCNIFIKALW